MTRMRVVVPRPGTRTLRMPTGPSPRQKLGALPGRPCSRSPVADLGQRAGESLVSVHGWCSSGHILNTRRVAKQARRALSSSPMKITAIESVVLSLPCAPPMSLEFAEHRMVAAFISHRRGRERAGLHPGVRRRAARSPCRSTWRRASSRLLIGEDPLFVERLWERMYRADRGIKRQGIAAYALSALDIGLWDIAGKVARSAALQALGRLHRPRRGLRQRRLGHATGSRT